MLTVTLVLALAAGALAGMALRESPTPSSRLVLAVFLLVVIHLLQALPR